jgi:hypothetical protein
MRRAPAACRKRQRSVPCEISQVGRCSRWSIATGSREYACGPNDAESAFWSAVAGTTPVAHIATNLLFITPAR